MMFRRTPKAPEPVRETVWVDRPDGTQFPTTRTTEFDPVPVPPLDWDLISTRIAVGMVLALTLVAVAWSTWSIGSLLHGGIGYLAAAVFDLSWGTALILEWKSRYDPDKRTFPLVLGWGLLAVTMGAIFWHAWPDLRYAVVGAVVSGVAKILWLAIMKHIQVTLNDIDRDDLMDRRSKASVSLAFASVDRQVMRTDAATDAVRRSLEAARPVRLEVAASTADTDREELERVGQEQADRAREQIAKAADAREAGQPRTAPGSTKQRVRILYENGTTDPAEIIRALPDANPETVRRHVRTVRAEGGYA
ncbi:hypothetical protein AB0B50_16320 [Streptomyces sp. NPDC041068]|uniref:hypothetical protein n=1 Tax=Streptomyces sp. NPDC041068 TaxID=3155130 RepID=UPI0033D61A96